MIFRSAGFVAIISISGCGPEVRELDSISSSTRALASTAPAYPAYQHTLTKTGFIVGENVRSLKDADFERVIGDLGVFATDSINGSVLGIPNGSSGREQLEPFTSDAETHNKAVLDYFISAGMPASQVGSVNVTTLMLGTGSQPDGRDSPAQFVAYTSVLERRIGGILVGESFAWARLAKDGSVVREGVYWPEIPTDVVDQATQLRSRLASSSSRAQLLAAASSSLADLDESTAVVVIHHCPFTYRGAFKAFAVVDVTVGAVGTKPHVAHLDESGKTVIFDHERPTPVQARHR